MLLENWCKDCFRTIVDSTAKDRFLLLTKDVVKCPCCGRMDRVVCEYFKYGEHEVTPDGSRIIDAARHIGVDLTTSCWKVDTEENNVEKSDSSLCTED